MYLAKIVEIKVKVHKWPSIIFLLIENEIGEWKLKTQPSTTLANEILGGSGSRLRLDLNSFIPYLFKPSRIAFGIQFHANKWVLKNMQGFRRRQNYKRQHKRCEKLKNIPRK